MGQENRATCKECGHEFSVRHGGGFRFHLLRCDECGETKALSFDELGELSGYLKGVPSLYSILTSAHHYHIRKPSPIKPISEAVYHKGVEKFAGQCKCGGNFRFDAPARCPNCRSTNIEEGETTILNN